MEQRKCPICGAPYGFHDDPPHDAVRVPAHLRLPTATQERKARPKQVRPSEEEIARLRAAKAAKKENDARS